MGVRRAAALARGLIADPGTEILFSVVNGWEIAIKARAGRLDASADVPGFVTEQVRRNNFGVLPVQLSHALQVYRLPEHHRDPFERLLVAKARVEGVPIVTRDPAIAADGIEMRW